MIHGGRTQADGDRLAGFARNGDGAPSSQAELVRRVEAVVRSVLAEMFRQADERPDSSTPSRRDVFPGGLLGLRDAEVLADGTREIFVAPGTVITPMARDHLRRQGVAVRWASHGDLVRAGARGEWGFAVEDGTGSATALKRALLDQEREAWQEVGADHIEAAHWVGAAPHRGAVVVTPEASVATWRACRVPNVRAATVADPGAVARACRHLGANLLVIEPAGLSIYSMRHLCTAFRRAGAPRCPEHLAGAEPSRTSRRAGGVS